LRCCLLLRPQNSLVCAPRPWVVAMLKLLWAERWLLVLAV
jgi:hypothetical protein